MNIVLLSGGSGTRLWPLSNDARSKQFLKVLRDKAGRSQSMVQRTFEMIREANPGARIVVATCASQVYSLKDQVPHDYEVVVEPERRDTAPAIMLASVFLHDCCSVDLDETVVVMPIDTYADQAYYDLVGSIDAAVQSVDSDLVLLGACPTYPSSKFGYIVPRSEGSIRKVDCFVEKPSEDEARRLIEEGALWNCGVFGFKLGYLLSIAEKYHATLSYKSLLDSYHKLPKNSFDYEVVEKADAVSVIPYDGQWKDLGTWNTLTEEMAKAESGRVLCDDFCKNTHVVNETELPMVVAGMEDSVVVATPDGILVSTKERSAHIKPYVSQVAETRPMYESRQWGEYSVLGFEKYEDDTHSLEKMLVIEPGKQLSYQRHSFRMEVWTIVSGEGEVVLDGEVREVEPGSVVIVPAGVKHAVKASSRLHIVEVQLGKNLTEDDIERFSFFWPAQG